MEASVVEQLLAAVVRLQAQQQQTLEMLAQQVQAPAPVPNPAVAATNSAWAGLRIPKMGPEDEPETFLTIFEHTARCCSWPESEWAESLDPLLSGEAQSAAQVLRPEDALDYKRLKDSVLDQVGLTLDGQRRKPRSLRFEPGSWPRAVLQQLRDACHHLLKPDEHSATEVADLVALEQFLCRLPPPSAEWVQAHQPKDLEEVTKLAENHLAAWYDVTSRHPMADTFPPSPKTLSDPAPPDTSMSPETTAPKPVSPRPAFPSPLAHPKNKPVSLAPSFSLSPDSVQSPGTATVTLLVS